MEVAVPSEEAVEVLGEAAVSTVVAVAADALEIAATAHLTAHLQALGEAVVEDMEVATVAVALMTADLLAATLTSSLCLLVEEATAVATATGTVIATVPADTLDRSDLTTAVGMMNQGRDAATEWLTIWAPDALHRARERPADLSTATLRA